MKEVKDIIDVVHQLCDSLKQCDCKSIVADKLVAQIRALLWVLNKEHSAELDEYNSEFADIHLLLNEEGSIYSEHSTHFSKHRNRPHSVDVNKRTLEDYDIVLSYNDGEEIISRENNGRYRYGGYLISRKDAAALCGYDEAYLIGMEDAFIADREYILEHKQECEQKLNKSFTKLSEYFNDRMQTVKEKERLLSIHICNQSKSQDILRCKPKQLKCINSLKQWTTFSTPSCVYFLMNGDEIVYVGQTTNLDNRLKAHLKENKKIFDRVYYRPTPIDKLLKDEAHFINKYQPRYNIILNNKPYMSTTCI